MFTIRVAKTKLGFSAAHFLLTHEKCSRLHGHNYKVRVAVRGETDENGMVIDFHALMQRVLAICKEIDHKVIVPGKSPRIETIAGEGEIKILLPDREYILPLDDIIILPIHASTAEEISRYFYNRLSEKIKGLSYVEVEESPGSIARYKPD